MQSKFHRSQHLLNALPVLEASVRLGSFTKAGEHLGLSQPTVSRHISNLEEHLGTALFVRNHNKLTITKQGRELASAADLGLSHIDSAVRKITMEAVPDGLRLACTQSFANCWLLPRFSQLRHAVDGQQIHLLPSYWLDDIDPEGVDVIVHWRPQGWAGWPSMRLFDEITFPVCAPEYLARNPSLGKCINDPSLLSQFRLLHYEERATEFVRWRIGLRISIALIRCKRVLIGFQTISLCCRRRPIAKVSRLAGTTLLRIGLRRVIWCRWGLPLKGQSLVVF